MDSSGRTKRSGGVMTISNEAITYVLLPGRVSVPKVTHLSRWFLPEGYRYVNMVVRDVHSALTLSLVLDALRLTTFAEHMAALYALTGCRAPETLTESE